MANLQDDELTERLSFHGITAEVISILRDNKDYILRLLPKALNAFYRHVAQHPSVARYFTDPAHIDHAKRKQIEHWGLLLDGNFDADYVASVKKIGEVHHRIGLEPRWYIGGYNFLLRSLISIMAIEDFGGDLVATRDALEATPVQLAITSVMMLDMDCSIEVYMALTL